MAGVDNEPKVIFKTDNITIMYDNSVDERGRILVLTKDRKCTSYGRYIVNHLSIDDAYKLRDVLDDLSKYMEE